jgi:transposase
MATYKPTFQSFDGMTPQQVNSRRKVAEALTREGMSTEPVQHWTQALARVAQSGVGGFQMGSANKGEAEGRREAGLIYTKALTNKAPMRDVASALMGNPWSEETGQELAVAQLKRDNKIDETDAPSTVREWQYFNALPPEDQSRFLAMKRSSQYLDLGDRFAQPDPLNAGGTVREVPKNLIEAERQKGVGEALAKGAAGLPKAQGALGEYELKNKFLIGDKETPGLIDTAMQQANGLTTGFVGSMTRQIPGTTGFDLSKTLVGIQSNLGFETLQQMRDNSPTGGALGQVTERELELLQSTWGSLEQAQTKEQFVSNLQRLKAIKTQFAVLKRKAYERDVSIFGRAAVPNPDAGASPVMPDATPAVDLKQKYGLE